jgi:4-hydroxy-tetrahydrodipicolinate synthase
MFQGSFTALITPFKDGAVDEVAFQSFVEWQIEQGSHGLVPCGTTGESPTLTHEEHNRVVDLCIEAAGGRVPVITGTGSNSTEEAIALTAHAKKAGADAALLVTPYYNKPTQRGLYAHYKAIHDAVDIPIIIYNIPGRSAVNMTTETMADLGELPRIIGVKDATGDLARISATRLLLGSNFVQLSGDDATALAAMVYGGHGCISVTANVAPRMCAEFQEACLKRDFSSALAYHDRLMPLHTSLFLETSPAPVKYAVSVMGLSSEELRLPMVPVSEETKDRIRASMTFIGVLV